MAERVTKRYSAAFKHKVVDELEQGRWTISQAQRRYQIGSHNTILRWLEQLGSQKHTAKIVHIRTGKDLDLLEQLEKENKELRQVLAKTYMEKLALETTLEIASEEYGVDLKKNYGTDRSDDSLKKGKAKK